MTKGVGGKCAGPEFVRKGVPQRIKKNPEILE